MKGQEGLDEVLKEYKSGHKIVYAQPKHIIYLAKNLRVEDQIEVSCMNKTPQQALLIALSRDDLTLTVLDPYNIPYAMFGAGKIDDETYIWMLGTEDVYKYRIEFLKRCREWVWGFVDVYEKVFNLVHVDNKLAIRWLEWCKAEFSDPIQINGHNFKKFTITKDNI